MPDVKDTQSSLLTVCVPTYNHENYIEEALESILSQSVDNLHIIVADDASQDNTLQKVRALKEKYKTQIFLIEHSRNVGLMHNVESIYECIPENTKYISWFSGDDIMLPGKLSRQIEFLSQNNDHIMCYHDVLVRDDDRNTQYRYNDPLCSQKPYQGEVTKKLIEHGCFIPALSTLVRYDQTKHIKHNLALGIYNDWAYFIELSRAGRIGYIDRVLSIYRRHSGNISKTPTESQETVCILEFMRQKYSGLNDAVDRGLIRHHLISGWKYMMTRRLSDSLSDFKKALKVAMTDSSLIFPFISMNIILIAKRVVLFLKIRSFFK